MAQIKEEPTPRYSPILALVAATLGFMQLLDSAIINTSLPQMARGFAISTVDMSLGITAYTLASAAIAPLANWLADRFRARNVLLVSVLCFTAASIWCGLSRSFDMLVVARIAQGASAALMLPVGTAIVMRHTPKDRMLHATAVQVWPALVAPIIGPVLGGFITQTIGWRWNFWLNIPFGLVGALVVLRFVPLEAHGPRRRLDTTGFVLCATGLTCLLAGFQRSSMGGSERNIALGLVVFGAGTGWLAIRHLRRVTAPLLSLHPLLHPSMFYAALYPGILLRIVFFATPFLLPLLFQLGFGLQPAAAGGWVLVYFVGNLAIKPATTPILRRFGFRNVLIFNGVLVVLSLIGCALLTPTMPFIASALILFAAGAIRSTQLTAMISILYADVPTAERGAAANLAAMLQQISQAAGVALGAFCLSLFQTADHRLVVRLPEIRDTFLVCAAIGFIGVFGFLRVPHDLGREVSGHRLKTGNTGGRSG